MESVCWLGVGEEEGEGNPQAPELAVVVGVAPQGGEVLDASALVALARELQVDARVAGRPLLSRVAFACSVGVREEVAVGDLGELALAEG